MTDSTPSMAPPPGWYGDSPSSTRLRWWNGSAWTDHYQAATDPVPVGEAPADDPARPMTRADLRASRQTPAVVSSGEPGPVDPVPDAFPDQILDRSIRTKEDRPLPPVVYLPQPSGYVRVPQGTFVPVTSQNGPAKSSLVLILISVVGGVAAYFFVGRSNPALAGLLNLLVVTVLFAAVGLAVVGLVLAVRRPTRKRESVFALVASLLMLGGVLTLFALRMISLGAVYAGG